MNDIIWQKKSNATYISLDAQKFFDRIFPNVENLFMASLGLPQTIGTSLSRTILNMTHRVRTMHGVSKKSFQCDPHVSWSGVCQGCAEAFPEWISAEDSMIQVYKQFSPGIHLTCPDNSKTFTIYINGYVDDMNMTFLSEAKSPQEKYIIHMNSQIHRPNLSHPSV